jgi:hypothetical protein
VLEGDSVVRRRGFPDGEHGDLYQMDCWIWTVPFSMRDMSPLWSFFKCMTWERTTRTEMLVY